jgi:enhancer of mRNA-decapping protein 4
MEVLSNSAVSALQPAVQHVCKEFFTSILVPSFEKSCQSMFQQINESFSKGTRECKFPFCLLPSYVDIRADPL